MLYSVATDITPTEYTVATNYATLLENTMETDSSTPAEKPYLDFGERLQIAMDRTIPPTSVAKLAAAIEVSGQMVGKYLRGESLPSKARMAVIAELLNITPEHLLGNHDYPVPGRRAKVLRIAHDTVSRVLERTSKPIPTWQQLPVPLSEDAASEQIKGDMSKLIGSGVKRPPLPKDIWEQLRERERILKSNLTDYLNQLSEDSRPDLEVEVNKRIEGPYFTQIVDLVIKKRTEEFGIGISIESGLKAAIPAAVGEALNWKRATKGAPFMLLWIAPVAEANDGRLEMVRKTLSKLERTEDDLFTFVISESVIDTFKILAQTMVILADATLPKSEEDED